MADKKKQEQADEQEASEVIAYYYLPSENPLGASLPGVPLCDLHADKVARYPQHIQNSIKGSAMYVSELPKPEKEGDKGGDK